MAKKLLLVINNPAFFVAQHAHLGVAAREAGYEVHVGAPHWEGVEDIRALGFSYHPIRMGRGMVKPIREARSVWDLFRLYRRLKPDLVHHITMKPILYGSLAASMAGVPAVVNGNTGLGYAFIDDTPATCWLRRAMVVAYKMAVRHRHRMDLFLNPDDFADFKRFGIAKDESSMIITGPGVELDVFTPRPEPEGTPLVVLAARLLWHKGVDEFVTAARKLKAKGVQARFILVGEPDEGNMATVTRARLQAWHQEGVIEWWGFRKDMAAVFAGAHVAVLPSYREGLGKVLIEAAACARPLVATDVAGCREICRDGINGFLVPPQDSDALAEVMEKLIADPALRRRFGYRGRAIVEAEFGTDTIGRQTVAVYDALAMPGHVKRMYPQTDLVPTAAQALRVETPPQNAQRPSRRKGGTGELAGSPS